MSIQDRPGAARTNARSAGVQPIVIVRKREIAATPETIFAVIADPKNLAQLLPNVRSVEIIEQSDDRARLITSMSLGPLAGFKVEGVVRWRAGREIVFRSEAPIAVESSWSLTPVAGGTRVDVALKLDLASVIGPLAAFVPAEKVVSVVAPDMDAALDKIAARVALSHV
jgi:carbon monoxide dehydrogenase subunit G